MEQIYNYEKGELYGSYKDKVTFDLQVRKPLVQVYGKSASGKSLLVDYIRALKRYGKLSNIKNPVSNIEVFDDELSLDELSGIKNSLVIIDRGDYILTTEIVECIRKNTDNHYLVFARTGLPFGLTPNYYGEFVCTQGVIKLVYDCSDPCWFRKG